MARSKAEKRLEQVSSLALDMEEPLRDATQYVLAMRLMADGLIQHDCEQGEAVYVVAWAAFHRLEALKKAWDKTCDAAGRK